MACTLSSVNYLCSGISFFFPVVVQYSETKKTGFNFHSTWIRPSSIARGTVLQMQDEQGVILSNKNKFTRFIQTLMIIIQNASGAIAFAFM